MLEARNFEEAMSLLALAVGYVQRNPPSNQCEASRLGEQVGRIDRIWAKSAAAVKFSAAIIEASAPARPFPSVVADITHHTGEAA